MARVVVIGDVGGHPDQLRQALSYVGPRGAQLVLPDDVVVVQVGDLVDRGPDSGGVLRLVHRYLSEQPEQWIQLVGNHEAQYLPGGTAFWPEPLARADAELIGSWWAQGQLNVAAAVRTADGDDLLVTHAGLTLGCWQELDQPMTAASAARLLNDRPAPLIWRGGEVGAGNCMSPGWSTTQAAGSCHSDRSTATPPSCDTPTRHGDLLAASANAPPWTGQPATFEYGLADVCSPASTPSTAGTARRVGSPCSSPMPRSSVQPPRPGIDQLKLNLSPKR